MTQHGPKQNNCDIRTGSSAVWWAAGRESRPERLQEDCRRTAGGLQEDCRRNVNGPDRQIAMEEKDELRPSAGSSPYHSLGEITL